MQTHAKYHKGRRLVRPAFAITFFDAFLVERYELFYESAFTKQILCIPNPTLLPAVFLSKSAKMQAPVVVLSKSSPCPST